MCLAVVTATQVGLQGKGKEWEEGTGSWPLAALSFHWEQHCAGDAGASPLELARFLPVLPQE